MKQSNLESIPNLCALAGFSQVSVDLLQLSVPAGGAELLRSPAQRLDGRQKQPRPLGSAWGRLGRSRFVSSLTHSRGGQESGCVEEWMPQPFLNQQQKEFTDYRVRVNPWGIRCVWEPLKLSHQYISVAFIRTYTLKPIFEVSNILVFLTLSLVSVDIFTHVANW